MSLRTLSLIGFLLMHGADVAPLSAEPFTLGSLTTEIPESGLVTYTTLRTEKAEAIFLPPAGWKSDIDAKSGIIRWTSPDFQSMIRLTISSRDGEQAGKLRPEELRETVLQEIADAKINEEFPCFTSGGSGLALDCEHVVKKQFVKASRVAVVPLPGGLAQFTLTSPKDQFVKRQIDFSRFLNSFRSESRKSQ